MQKQSQTWSGVQYPLKGVGNIFRNIDCRNIDYDVEPMDNFEGYIFCHKTKKTNTKANKQTKKLLTLTTFCKERAQC